MLLLQYKNYVIDHIQLCLHPAGASVWFGVGCGQEMKENPEKWLAGQAASSWTGPDWEEK